LERFIASSKNAPSRSPSHHKSRLKRLVAISGVRNERDVIEAFVRHTTALVDHLIILDNGSTDGTREILASLVGEGLPITVKYSDSLGYSQSGWMTALMHEAAQDPEAEWILPLDADEFLSANIRELLSPGSAARSRNRVTEITLRTYLPEGRSPSSINPVVGAHRFIVHATGPWGAKVIVPAEIARKPGVVLHQGNHHVFRNSSHIESEPAGDQFFLAHFPIRSVGQYSAKIAIGWLQYLATPGRPDKWGYHWRDAFERLKSDAASFATDFNQEVSRSCTHSAEIAEPTTSEGPADYLGGELKYTPDPTYNSYQFEQLLRYAEVQARRIADLSKDRPWAELGEIAALPSKVDNYVTNRRFGWSLIFSYPRWIATARERHPFVRKVYEPLAIRILRSLGMAERPPK
jgi:glycosyltransferase involved in cell wall biosynthesis